MTGARRVHRGCTDQPEPVIRRRHLAPIQLPDQRERSDYLTLAGRDRVSCYGLCPRKRAVLRTPGFGRVDQDQHAAGKAPDVGQCQLRGVLDLLEQQLIQVCVALGQPAFRASGEVEVTCRRKADDRPADRPIPPAQDRMSSPQDLLCLGR